MKKNFLLAASFFFIFCLEAGAQKRDEVTWEKFEDITIPIPPSTHPRLYVRPANLPDLKKRMDHPQVKANLATLRKLGIDRTAEEEAKVTDRGFRYYFEMRGVTSRVQVQALDYLVYGDKKQARRAITSMLDSLQHTNFGTKQDLSRASGVMLMCGAMVYDWCYDQMKESEKKAYIESFIRISKTMECGYPPKNNEPIAGHSSEWMILRDMLSAGIAIYDEYPDMYRRRPDGQVMPAGDTNPNKRNIPSYSLPAMLASSFYKDNYLAYEYELKPKLESHCLIFEILWRDFDLKAKAPDDLPLTRYSGSPFGWMIARTGWDKNSVIAEMKINEQFFGNHQHMDGGSFQLYYKGPLAIDAGAYQGSSGGYNSPHNKNFFKRTIAHNSLLVYNPNEKFASWNYGGQDKTEFADNDGGQRMPGDRWETCRSFKDLLSKEYTTGKVLGHGFGPDANKPDYSYLKGDITQAYTDKVKEAKRSFVFLNLHATEVPAALIVFDKVVSADPQFKKFWLLHSIEEPIIESNRFTVKRTKNEDTGMLQNQVLLPEIQDARIEKIGGKGKEFWVFGTNYANDAMPRRPDDANERGAWRIEISPATATAENYFLNVMQVADNTCLQMNEVKRIDADKIVGVQIADRVVTFSKDSQPLPGKFNFAVSGGQTMKFVITDLIPGTWQIKKDGKVYIPALEVRTDDGILSFEGTAGRYEFLR